MPDAETPLGDFRRGGRVVTGLRLAERRRTARKRRSEAGRQPSTRSQGTEPGPSVGSEPSSCGFARALGARLREARRQRGLTLQNVDDGTAGAFASVTLSSYERGERTLSVARLVELAAFYGVPPAELLPSQESAARPAASIVSIDLLRVAKLPPYQAGPLLEAARVSAERGSATFTLGGERLARVARSYGLPVDKVVDLLASWGVFAPVGA